LDSEKQKTHELNQHLPPILFPRVELHHSSTSSTLSSARGWGMGLGSVHNSSPLLLCLAYAVPLLQHGFSCSPSRKNLVQYGLSTSCVSCQEMSICSTVVLSMGCRVISSPAPRATLPPSPSSLTLVFRGCFFLSPHCWAAFCPFKVCFSRGATSLAAGLSCALWWVCWSSLEVAVCNMGQPRILLTEGPAGPHWRTLPHTPRATSKTISLNT